jgi:DNA invertase Pin-like site-specific DNA recombinase
MPEIKVTSHHLQREAYLYIRQSSLRQVYEHSESTKRQYDLRSRAVALGWAPEQIRTIDHDLGKSGAQAEGRDGFQQLVSEVALGKAGIVMGLEVSRLARNNADWHRLLELCGLTNTLILDEDGVYDPTNFNDRLLLGLKGAMSEAELHLLKARMRGGVLSKARRGELEMGPPIGLVYREDGALILDPDAEVQGTIRLVFDTFQRTGSAMQTLRHFLEEGLRFPKRIRSGERKGELVWIKPGQSRIVQILHNPRYAGAFVYGRTRTRHTADGKYKVEKIPPSEWQFVVRDLHPGYISWEQFEANQKRLAENALGFGKQRLAGPAREGPALLQGRVMCGICGGRMSVHYYLEDKVIYPVYKCQEESVRRGGRVCQSVPGKVVDAAIGKLLLELMTPMTVEAAWAVQQEVEARLAETDQLRRGQVERARYEAELARRRYFKVDPDNRLVADVLEAEWNDKLRAYQEAQEEYERKCRMDQKLISNETREKILAMVGDFPQIWNDPNLEPRERKRMLRLLIEDVTLIKAGEIVLHIRLRGGGTRTLKLPRPAPITELCKTKPETVAEIDRLLDEHSDDDVAEILTRQGHRTWRGEPYTGEKIGWIRYAYHLSSRYDRLRARGCLTAKELSVELGVSTTTINQWGRDGLLRRHRYDQGSGCLYEPLQETSIVKGHGGRGGRGPSFTVQSGGRSAV